MEKKNMTLSSMCKTEIFIGTLTYKYFPAHRYRNILLDFFKICYASVNTEVIHFGDQIHFKLHHIPQMAGHTVRVEQAHNKLCRDDSACTCLSPHHICVYFLKMWKVF